ncbi:hypothetical protein FOL47_002764 [Perkinsus chesapeaki]|uniref:Uncharacterized protein n=1 Tax=Perkinsus chesapeaki TaxID=330153 RepID=A0A7J6N2H8_PERCH|nr:hypothetical protein FOL47_002764 [Perkinsus chesapeaki]
MDRVIIYVVASNADPTNIVILYRSEVEDDLVHFKNVANKHLSTCMKIKSYTDSALTPGSDGIGCIAVNMKISIWVLDLYSAVVLHRTYNHSSDGLNYIVATKDWEIFMSLTSYSFFRYCTMRTVTCDPFLTEKSDTVLPDRIPDCLWSHTRVAFPTRIGQDDECYLQRVFNYAAADTVNRELLGVMWDCEVVSLPMADFEEDPTERAGVTHISSSCIIKTDEKAGFFGIEFLDIDFATSDCDLAKVFILCTYALNDGKVYFRNKANETLSKDMNIKYRKGCALIPGSGGIACVAVYMGDNDRFFDDESMFLNEWIGIWVVDPYSGIVLYRTDGYSANSVIVATRDWEIFMILAANRDPWDDDDG